MGYSDAVTVQLICTFVFTYGKSRFSHDMALMVIKGQFCLFLHKYMSCGNVGI